MLDFIDTDKFITTLGAKQYQNIMRIKLRFFFTWINDKHPQFTDILKIPPAIYEEYFHYINKKNAIALNKNRDRKILYRYIEYCRRKQNIRKRDLEFEYDDIFDKENFKFISTGTEREETPLTIDQVVDCLKYWHGHSYEFYIFYSILAYTGCRIGGACGLTIDSIDLKKRKVRTHEKPTKWFGKNDYIIPKGFVPKLESYIEEIKLLRPNDTRLFQFTDKTYRKRIKEWGSDAKSRLGWEIDIHPHLFRDALNTFLKKNGMTDPEDRCLILIQMPDGVNPQKYLKRMKQFEERRDLYDKFFPFSEPLP